MKPVHARYSTLTFALLACLAAAAGVLTSGSSMAESSLNRLEAKEVDGGKYVGAKKCKLCHNKESTGGQYKKWEEMKHAHAYEVLASDAAKAIAKERKIEDPQKAAECLKCHVTAYGKPAEAKDDKFDDTLGVQCESCHGPAEKHVKARQDKANKGQPVPEGEIVANPAKEVCTGCHNKESPNYKEFNYEEFVKKIAHPNPAKDDGKKDGKDEKKE